MTQISARPSPIAGMFGFAAGAAAFILVLVHFWAGPFAPQQGVTISIGEMAAEIREAATRAISGEAQPEATVTDWTLDKTIKLVAAVLAGLAVILGLAGMIRRETWRPAAGAITLGVAAVVFQMFVWAAMLIVGCILLFAIIQNVDGILGS